MSNEPVMAGMYGVDCETESVDRALEICERLGFETEDAIYQDSPFFDFLNLVSVPHGDWSVTFSTGKSPDEDPNESDFSIRLDRLVYPSEFGSTAEHEAVMDVVFELVCRLAMEFDVEYVAVYGMDARGEPYIPQDRPIASGLAEPARMAIFSPDLLDSLGGIESVYDQNPWYTGTLSDGRRVIIKTKRPWGEEGWTPPTDAEYIESATLTDSSDDIEVGDPFADLAPGEYGADIVVPRGDLAPEFDNETAELLRVYVDENRDLRRVADDSFVRNVVTDTSGSELEVIGRMASDLPPGGKSEDVSLSVLLNDQIPALFVRLDDPDDENVVTLVMTLTVDMSKYQILMTLANNARPETGYTETELESIEGGLSTLAAEDDPELVEAWIREHFFE